MSSRTFGGHTLDARSATVITDVRRAAVSLVLGAIAWETAGRTLHYSFLPPFSAVLRAAVAMVVSGEVPRYLVASLVSLAIGYAISAVSGVAIGALMGRFRTVDVMLQPYVTAILVAPKLIFVPILYTFLGVGRSVQIAVVILNCVLIIAVSTRSGILEADERYIEMARAFGASERQLLGKVILPGALPMILAGLRLGMGRAVTGMIKGEMYISLFGLGALLRKYGSRFDAARVFAILLFVVGVAVSLSFFMGLIERRLTSWTEQE